MTDPIDACLHLLAATPAPAGIDGVEDAVLARLATQPERAGGRIAGLIGIAAALALGIGGGIAGAGASLVSAAPIGLDRALAPSTLLLGR